MRKRIFAIIFTLVLCAMATAHAGAAGAMPRLVDGADYLTASEEEYLLAYLDEISNSQGLDVVIVTVSSLYGEDIADYADYFYDYNGYGRDGILLLVADAEREWAISTSGYGITVFTDYGQEYLAKRFSGLLSSGVYSQAFHTFADECDVLITMAREGEPYDEWVYEKEPYNAVGSIILALVIGFVGAMIRTSALKRELRTVRSQAGASQYTRQGSMKLTESREIFLYRQVSRTRRVQAETSSGRPRGSSTHISSSGRTHGGSRGRF